MQTKPRAVRTTAPVVPGGDQRLRSTEVDQLDVGGSKPEVAGRPKADELVHVQIREARLRTRWLEDVGRRGRVLRDAPVTIIEAMQRHLVLDAGEAPAARACPHFPAGIADGQPYEKIVDLAVGEPTDFPGSLRCIRWVDISGENLNGSCGIAPHVAKEGERVSWRNFEPPAPLLSDAEVVGEQALKPCRDDAVAVPRATEWHRQGERRRDTTRQVEVVVAEAQRPTRGLGQATGEDAVEVDVEVVRHVRSAKKPAKGSTSVPVSGGGAETSSRARSSAVRTSRTLPNSTAGFLPDSKPESHWRETPARCASIACVRRASRRRCRTAAPRSRTVVSILPSVACVDLSRLNDI